MPRTARMLAPLAAACLCGAVLSGCAWWKRPAPVAMTPDQLDDDILSPAVLGGDDGLELRWWVVAEQHDEVARALAPYLAQPLAIDGALADVWRVHGLRMIRVPLADIPGLRRAMPVLGRVDRQWLGQIPRWTELLQGDRVDATTGLLVGGARMPMPDGRMRLLARAWTAPTAHGARLRVDMTLQHAPTARDALLEDFASMGRRSAEERGSVFTELTANMTLDPGYAYLIVPEDPARAWTSAGALSNRAWRGWGEIAGPPAPLLPTPGEALLTSLSSRLGDTPLRAIVMLVPRTPERYSLLPGPVAAR